MGSDKIERNKLHYITIVARIALLFLCLFIIRAYFYPISHKFYFTSSDELMHFTGFLVLGFILALSFPRHKHTWILLGIIIMGIILEVTQPLLTLRRELSLSDMISNTSGGIIGYGLAILILWIISELYPSNKA